MKHTRPVPFIVQSAAKSACSMLPARLSVGVRKSDMLQDGLVHISCIAAGRVKDVSEHLDVGETVWVKVMDSGSLKNKGRRLERSFSDSFQEAVSSPLLVPGCKHQPGGRKAWTGHETLESKSSTKDMW